MIPLLISLVVGSAAAAPELRATLDPTVVLLPDPQAAVVAVARAGDEAVVVQRDGSRWTALRFKGNQTLGKRTWTHEAPPGAAVGVDVEGHVWVGDGETRVVLGEPAGTVPAEQEAVASLRVDGSLVLGALRTPDPCPGAPAASADVPGGAVAVLLCADGPRAVWGVDGDVVAGPLPELSPPPPAGGLAAWSDPEGAVVAAWGDGAVHVVLLRATSGVPWRWRKTWVPGGETVPVPVPTVEQGETTSAVATVVRTGTLTAVQGLTSAGKHLYVVATRADGSAVVFVTKWRP